MRVFVVYGLAVSNGIALALEQQELNCCCTVFACLPVEQNVVSNVSSPKLVAFIIGMRSVDREDFKVTVPFGVGVRLVGGAMGTKVKIGIHFGLKLVGVTLLDVAQIQKNIFFQLLLSKLSSSIFVLCYLGWSRCRNEHHIVWEFYGNPSFVAVHDIDHGNCQPVKRLFRKNR